MSHNNDPYLYPDTDTLINTAGIRDQQQPEDFERDDQFELDIAAFSLSQPEEIPVSGPFAGHHLKEADQRIFAGICPWAGEYRQNTGMMVKVRQENQVMYADSAYTEPELNKFFHMPEKEPSFHSMNPENFSERPGYFYGNPDALHLFREGNSRTLRQFLSDLAFSAGMTLDWFMVVDDDAGRKHYPARDMAVINADSSMPADMRKKSVSPIPTQTANNITGVTSA